MPLELGRTLLVKGTLERRSGHKREARGSIEEALAIFEGLGSPLWVEKALSELERIGGPGNRTMGPH